jgi:hypothetical protein
VTRLHPLVLRIAFALGACAPLAAQWSDDPAANLALADRPGAQVLPKIAARSAGGSYAGWLDHASGNYDVYLQRLDSIGVELWRHDGRLISAHPSAATPVDWDLLADSSGRCVLVVADARAGGDLDVYAYRVGDSGEFVWGADGVRLSVNDDAETDPKALETSDAHFVFAWTRTPSAGAGSVRIQKLDAAGTPEFQSDGLAIDGAAGEHPMLGGVVAAENGGFIVAWVSDAASAATARHVRAQKFDAAGHALWNGGAPLEIYDASSLPPGYAPVIRSDDAGGALIAWHADAAGLLASFVQHVDASGVELFAHEGAHVATTPNVETRDPSLSYLAAAQETIVFFREHDATRTLTGISAQKLSSVGAREWSDDGVAIVPLSAQFESEPMSLLMAGGTSGGAGAEVFFFERASRSSSIALVAAQRVDARGAPQFGTSPVIVSSAQSDKSSLAVARGSDGVAALVWQDARNDASDIYGENLNPDGTIGITCYTEEICTSAPNSVGPGSIIGWTGSLSIATNTFTLTANGCPPRVAGFFYYGTDTVPVPFGDGFQCVGGSVFRLGPTERTDANGNARRLVDFTRPPASSGPGMLGPVVTWFFQWYYRDENGPGGTGFNLSNALEIQFCR